MGSAKKLWNLIGWPRNGHDGKLDLAKILIKIIQVNCMPILSEPGMKDNTFNLGNTSASFCYIQAVFV